MRKNSTRIILVAISFVLNTSLFATDFVVTSAADAGPGSLRATLALADADNSAPVDNITFNIGAAQPIILASPLSINSPVNINGYGPTGGSMGIVTGRSIVVGIIAQSFDAIIVNSGNVTISGLAIYSDGNPLMTNGIVIGIAGGVGGPVKIWGNFIGADEFGTIFNNSGAANSGVNIAQENSVFYAYSNPRVIVGTDGDGVNDINEGNLISNNTTAGVYVGNCDNIVIAGNWIGTQLNGGATSLWQRGNGVGILLDGQYSGNGSSFNRVGTDGNGISDDLELNVISGNKQNGIVIKALSNNNVIAGNNIGLHQDLNSVAANKGNSQYFEGNGVLIYDAPNNSIVGNIIAGNNRNGMTLYSGNIATPTDGNKIQGNLIGTSNGSTAYGNGGWGIQLINFNGGSVSSNFIGSNDDGTNDPAEANVIKFNAKDGVALAQTSTGTVNLNRISRNIFGGNNSTGGQGAGLAINLLAGGNSNDGITVNDAGDADVGANTLFNYPVITTFGVDASFVSIIGTVNPGATVQFYLASADGAPANPNYKEGATFLINGTDNGPGDSDPALGSFNFLIRQIDLATTVPVGVEVNAIAFSAASGAANTSEFSTVTATILPVQFLSFDAALQGDKVLVTWTTAQERNASHFEVEKSTDGTNFKTIGRVAAAGNSSRKLNYSFTDNNVETGVSYYRLRQVDLDAKAVFTRVVPIRNEGRAGKTFFMWPNPVVDMMNITINQTKPEVLNIRIVDMNGRTMITNKVNTVRGLNQVRMNASSLPRGMYVVQIAGEETLITEKILKN